MYTIDRLVSLSLNSYLFGFHKKVLDHAPGPCRLVDGIGKISASNRLTVVLRVHKWSDKLQLD